MKNTIRQVFHSPKFVIGFGLFVIILLTSIIYPLLNPGDPLLMIGLGSFKKPGTYVSLYDAVGTNTSTFKLPDADANRLAKVLSDEDRVAMVNWFTAMDIDIAGLDITDTDALLAMWKANYDETAKPSGMTKAQRNYYKRLNNSILSTNTSDSLSVMAPNDADELEETTAIKNTDYIAVSDVANEIGRAHV